MCNVSTGKQNFAPMLEKKFFYEDKADFIREQLIQVGVSLKVLG